MITKLTSSNELEKLFVEALINKTEGRINKVSPNSVLSGVAYGVAKIAQKSLKEVALIESLNFPDSASGSMLDVIAEKNGISQRYGAAESSTWVKLVAEVGTTYVPATNQFRTNTGVLFQLEETVTIGELGYTYAKVRSLTQGKDANVNPHSINQMTTEPDGHIYVINEYRATGGRDIEGDFLFRRRIKEGANILAKGTLSLIEQAFNKINSNVLRVFYYGINNLGKPIIAVASVNGIDFNQQELDTLLEQGEKFFNLTELRPFNNQSYGVVLQNVVYQPVDVTFRVDLQQNADPDQVRIDIQTRFSKAVDYTNWKQGRKVEWDDLLEIVKSTKGVKYCPDQFFNPRTDIIIQHGKLPRFRSFLMLDMQGNILSDKQGNLNPIYYPAQPDLNYQATVMSSIL